VAVIVEDNGAGFDAEAVLSATPRLGLVGMRERAELLGGTLDIESSPARERRYFASAAAPRRRVGAAP
jgi:signal transduction histidine kinase